MKYRFELAGIIICVVVPFELKIQKESKEFVRKWKNEEGEADICLEFRSVKSLPQMISKGLWVETRYYEDNIEQGSRIYYATEYEGIPFACCKWDKAGVSGVCFYLQGKEYCLNYSRNIWDVLDMETRLLYHRGILLHSSFIRYRERGVLFSAPSGTGKSTQAELWEQYEGADIINGDRAGIRYLNGGWTAFGLPYAGSSQIYINEGAPLSAIILLKQSKKNNLRKLSPLESMPDLYREITVHRWDREFVTESTELLLQLIKDVPVYLLACRPEREAVELVKEELFNRIINE